MALLPEAGRLAVWRLWQRENAEGSNFTKADLRAAIDATDQWIEDNTSSFNLVLPQPFRSQASLTQKIALFAFCLWRRAGRLSTPEDG